MFNHDNLRFKRSFDDLSFLTQLHTPLICTVKIRRLLSIITGYFLIRLEAQRLSSRWWTFFCFSLCTYAVKVRIFRRDDLDNRKSENFHSQARWKHQVTIDTIRSPTFTRKFRQFTNSRTKVELGDHYYISHFETDKKKTPRKGVTAQFDW
jgi:hypothetical protein